MKRWYVVILALLCVGVIAADVMAAKKYEGEKMYVYAGIFPYSREFMMTYIAPALKDKWGIDLVVEEVGSQFMLEQMTINKNKPTVTIACMDVVIGQQAAAMGLTAPIDVTLAPNLEGLYDWARWEYEEQVHVLTTLVVGIGLLYNQKEFTKRGFAAPTSWQDLWRPELAGRISITAPESTWGTAALVGIAQWQGGSESNLEPGFAKLETLLPNIHTIHTWSSELVKLMQLGEVWLATTGSNMGPALQKEGFPAVWVAPAEGAPTANGGMVLVKNAPYQDVAYDFIDMFFSTEYLARRALWAGDVSPREDVWSILSPGDKAKLAFTNADFDKLVTQDWNIITKERAALIEEFHKRLPG